MRVPAIHGIHRRARTHRQPHARTIHRQNGEASRLLAKRAHTVRPASATSATLQLVVRACIVYWCPHRSAQDAPKAYIQSSHSPARSLRPRSIHMYRKLSLPPRMSFSFTPFLHLYLVLGSRPTACRCRSCILLLLYLYTRVP